MLERFPNVQELTLINCLAQPETLRIFSDIKSPDLIVLKVDNILLTATVSPLVRLATIS